MSCKLPPLKEPDADGFIRYYPHETRMSCASKIKRFLVRLIIGKGTSLIMNCSFQQPETTIHFSHDGCLWDNEIGGTLNLELKE